EHMNVQTMRARRKASPGPGTSRTLGPGCRSALRTSALPAAAPCATEPCATRCRTAEIALEIAADEGAIRHFGLQFAKGGQSGLRVTLLFCHTPGVSKREDGEALETALGVVEDFEIRRRAVEVAAVFVVVHLKEE